jgi:hypothetical protein
MPQILSAGTGKFSYNVDNAFCELDCLWYQGAVGSRRSGRRSKGRDVRTAPRAYSQVGYCIFLSGL